MRRKHYLVLGLAIFLLAICLPLDNQLDYSRGVGKDAWAAKWSLVQEQDNAWRKDDNKQYVNVYLLVIDGYDYRARIHDINITSYTITKERMGMVPREVAARLSYIEEGVLDPKDEENYRILKGLRDGAVLRQRPTF